MIAAVSESTPLNMRRAALRAAFLLVVWSVAPVGVERLFGLAVNFQRLHVIFVQWTPSGSSLSVEPLNALGVTIALTENELAELKTAGIAGRLTVVGGSKHEAAKDGRAVIVMQRQMQEAVQLAQPDGIDIIYVQHGNVWKRYPAGSPTISRSILLEPNKNNPLNTRYMVELPDGSAQGGTAFMW